MNHPTNELNMQAIRKAAADASTEQRVLVFPAQAKKVDSKQVYFLFSLNQMADILTATKVREIPFSAPYIKGITDWRGHILPVIVLEKMLGLEPSTVEEENRMAVVCSGQQQDKESSASPLAIIRISHTLKMLSLPIQYTAAEHSLPCDRKYIRGIYDWEEGILLVLHMENILSGKTETGAAHV